LGRNPRPAQHRLPPSLTSNPDPLRGCQLARGAIILNSQIANTRSAMTAHPDADPLEGEVWIRFGEMYIRDAELLFSELGIVALYPDDDDVYAFVQGRGKVPLGDLLKLKLAVVT